MTAALAWIQLGRRALAVALLGLAMAGCTGAQPDLKRLYALQSNPVDQPPVILVPGALGSRLSDADSGREIWPGPLWKLAFGDYSELALEIDPDTLEPHTGNLVVSGLTDRAAGRDFYAAILRVLEDIGGYHPAEAGTPPAPGKKHYYVLPYDWRQDNLQTVRELDAFIEQVRRDHGDPSLKVDIVAHSMGGLIARYYGRYGTQDVLDDNDFPVSNRGAERMRRVVLLGTPNLGAVEAVRVLKEGSRVGLDRIRPEIVATFPSTYQVLPHPLNTWLVTPDGDAIDRDVFSAYFWQRFQMSVFDPEVRARIIAAAPTDEAAARELEVLAAYFEKRIERARRFVWSLTVPEPDPAVRFIVFGGDCSLTPARILVEEWKGHSELRFDPAEVRTKRAGVDYDRLMLEPGDGVVTKASLLARQALDPTVARHRYIYFPLDYAFFLCVDHDQLTTNIHFQDNLLHVLLSADGTEIGSETKAGAPGALQPPPARSRGR